MRVSCTTLESFRLFTQPDQEWLTEEAFLASLRGEFTGNHKTWRGSAFGSVLEEPTRHQVDGGYSVTPRDSPEPFSFSAEIIQPALDKSPIGTIFEAKGNGQYAGHDVIAKADQICGAHIRETKTTDKPFDFDKYYESYQWRFELDIFQAAVLTYDIVLIGEDRDGTIKLKDIESFNVYPYIGMHEDCEALVRRFDEYVNAKGLTHLLNAKQAEAVGRFP